VSPPNPYTDSPYAHERVGFDLHCEASPDFPLTEGSIPKCIHCREEFEHHAEHPQPCIERIAMALEEARAVAPAGRAATIARANQCGKHLDPMALIASQYPPEGAIGTFWMEDDHGNLVGYHPSFAVATTGEYASVGDAVHNPLTGDAVGAVLAAPETGEPAIVTLASGSSIAVAGNGAHEASLPYDEAQAIMDDWKAAHDAEEGE
jgi:hypothetical protein